jgi:hypothetical protein
MASAIMEQPCKIAFCDYHADGGMSKKLDMEITQFLLHQFIDREIPFHYKNSGVLKNREVFFIGTVPKDLYKFAGVAKNITCITCNKDSLNNAFTHASWGKPHYLSDRFHGTITFSDDTDRLFDLPHNIDIYFSPSSLSQATWKYINKRIKVSSTLFQLYNYVLTAFDLCIQTRIRDMTTEQIILVTLFVENSDSSFRENLERYLGWHEMTLTRGSGKTRVLHRSLSDLIKLCWESSQGSS